MLLSISSRPKRQRTPWFRGGDIAELAAGGDRPGTKCAATESREVPQSTTRQSEVLRFSPLRPAR
jgi:hypothetical protein